MATANTVKGPKSDKVLRDALLLAVHREELLDGKPTKRITLIAEKLACLAVAGEAWAVREVWDRIEGKAMQAVEVKHDVEITLKSAVVSQLDSFFAVTAGRLEDQSDPDVVSN